MKSVGEKRSGRGLCGVAKARSSFEQWGKG